MEINPNNINVKLIIMASFLFIFAQYDDYELGDYIDGEEFEDLDEATKRFNDIKADTDLL